MPAANTPEHHVNEDVDGLSINVNIDKNTFRIGETAVLQFVSTNDRCHLEVSTHVLTWQAIDNKSTHKIDEISVKLEQHEDYHITTTKSSHKVTPFKQNIEKSALPINPGSS